MEIIFLLVGALFIAVGGVIIFCELQARSGTQSVRGVVIGFSKGRNNSNGFSFHSVAEYIGLNGSKYFAEGSVGSSVPLHKVGAPVTILVRPTEPEKAVFKSPLSYVLGSVLALMGLASTAVFWLTFRASTMSMIVAAVVVGAFALKIKRAWRKEPMTLQAWQEYKKQTLSPRVFQSKDEISWADPMSLSAAIDSYKKSNRFAVPILLLLGLGFLFASYYTYEKTTAFLKRADGSFGEVVDLKQTDPGGDSSLTYAAVVEYSDRRGQKHRLVDSFSSNPPTYRRGEIVRVVYNRESPDDARIDRGSWNFWLTGLCGSLGALFTLLGFWSARSRSRGRG